MPILLRNYLCASEVLSFEVDAQLLCDVFIPARTIGLYCRLAKQLLGLTVFGSDFYFWWDDAWHAVSSEFSICHHIENNQFRRLVVIGQNDLQVDIRYTVQQPVSTPFYSEDEEDVDFGLWLKNVLTSE
ncbi:hypothetical protein [Bremerella alba]|uniref:Uncharacterized protein n=1 Tax=Bremerella alba TaxID=980252 RepID=A0A7V9A892_9BACT|nr:hypothetical protein [Bremerella alba]MBA2116255.1 hypothetical protein [Bremerella alba]